MSLNHECFSRVLDKVKANLVEQLPDQSRSTFDAKWKNQAFVLIGNSLKTKIGIPIEYEYYRFKSSGERYQKRTKDSLSMMMSHCPFCGEELREEITSQADSEAEEARNTFGGCS